ncbi:MAG: Rieske (2Fe-2S) domain protein [Acidimicrobiales bacterium]|nr:Rieske (2Fe-2S) domain protein [Acidimicrobiales bacterium]
MTMLTNVDPSLRKAWHPVGRIEDLGDGPTRVTLLGEDWVVARLDGEVTAHVDRCPHRLAPLSAGRVDTVGGRQVLRCGYHGWCFEASGSCAEIPALGVGATLPPRARLQPAAEVAEHLGLVWIAPEEPAAPLPDPPIAADERHRFLSGHLPVLRAAASAGLLIDNFLDVAHFPFVHAATIGDEDDTEPAELDVVRDGLSLTARAAQRFPNREDRGVEEGLRPLLQTRHVHYRYTAPFAVWLRMDYEEAGGCNVITFFVQPVDAEHATIYTTVYRNDLDGDEEAMAAAVGFEHRVVAEDLVVQQAYRHRSIPLDLTTEVHIKTDRVTVELRRILKDFVAQAALIAPPVVGPATEGVADTGTSPAERSSDAAAPQTLEPAGDASG